MIAPTNATEYLGKLRVLVRRDQKFDEGPVATLRRLAEQLNLQMDPPKQWGWEYLHQVEREKMTASQSLKTAIERLYESKIANRETELLEEITLLAPSGYAKFHSVLLSSARECLLSDCKTSFIPKTPRQIYCSLRCRRLNSAMKKGLAQRKEIKGHEK